MTPTDKIRLCGLVIVFASLAWLWFTRAKPVKLYPSNGFRDHAATVSRDAVDLINISEEIRAKEAELSRLHRQAAEIVHRSETRHAR